MRTFRRVLLIVLCVIAWAGSARDAGAQVQVSSADGKLSLNFGLLAQPQFETLTTADGESTSKYFLMRRVRLLLSGKVTD